VDIPRREKRPALQAFDSCGWKTGATGRLLVLPATLLPAFETLIVVWPRGWRVCPLGRGAAWLASKRWCSNGSLAKSAKQESVGRN